jgi:hypothetical protein
VAFLRLSKNERLQQFEVGYQSIAKEVSFNG